MHLLPFLILSIFISSCSNKNQITKPTKNQLFEGTITYAVSYEPYTSLFEEDTLKEHLGSEIRIRFKNGNYKKQYFSPSGQLLSERYLDLSIQKSYHKPVDNDTIYWFDITKSDTKTTFKTLRDTIILNQPVRGVQTESIISVNGFEENSLKVSGVYYYSKKYKVNPDWYENYTEDSFYEIIKYGKGIQLFEFSKGVFWEQKTTLKTIHAQEIKDEQIKVPITENNILKEL